MSCTTSETEGEVGNVKLVKALSGSLPTVLWQWFCCGSLLLDFAVKVSATFHLNVCRLLSGHLLGNSCSLG